MSQAPAPLRVVLAGCGKMSGAWLQAARAIPNLSVVGLVDLNREAATARASEFGLEDAAVATELVPLLDDLRPEVLFDCTIPEAHSGVAISGLERGCHVLSEKPLATSLADAQRVLQAARHAGRLQAVMQNRRFDPGLRRLQAVATSGALGPVHTVTADFFLAPRFGGFREQMRHPLLLDMAIHTFDAARLLVPGDPAFVSCHEWNPPGSHFAAGASAVANFEFSSGAVFSYRGSWATPGRATSWDSAWRVSGSEGSATWDGEDEVQAEVVVERAGFLPSVRQLPAPRDPDPASTGWHAGMITHFIACVRAGRTPETAGEDNIKSLVMTLAAIESAERGERLPVRW